MKTRTRSSRRFARIFGAALALAAFAAFQVGSATSAPVYAGCPGGCPNHLGQQ